MFQMFEALKWLKVREMLLILGMEIGVSSVCRNEFLEKKHFLVYLNQLALCNISNSKDWKKLALCKLSFLRFLSSLI